MKVLLADDSALSRRLVEVTLAKAGHEVTSVADGEGAVAAFERVAPSLVILDWLMPTLDGIGACRRIRALPRGGDVFILMITGRDQSDDLVVALEAGVDDYVMKPVTPGMLAARVMIAERRLEQNALRRQAEAALAEAQRLAGIGETTLALEHEINNPLAALLMHSQMLASQAETPAMKEDLDLVVELTRRIADVVRRLKELKAPRTVQYLGSSSMIDLAPSEISRLQTHTNTRRDIPNSTHVPIIDALASNRNGGHSASSQGAPADESVDESELLKMVGGDRPLLRQMVELFFEEYPKNFTKVAVAVRRGDAEALEAVSHALKGAAMTLCAPRVAEIAHSLESMARASELEYASDAVDALERELAHAHAGLVRIIGG